MKNGVVFAVSACILIGFLVPAAGAEQSGPGKFLAGVQAEAERLFARHQYAEFLAYLETQAATARTDEERFYLTYYQLLAQSSYLDYLEAQEDWREYYARREPFSAHIISTAGELKNTYPVIASLIDVQFLVWRAHARRQDAAAEANAFGELGDMLFEYMDATGDEGKWREITGLVAQAGAAPHVQALMDRYREHVLQRAATATSPDELRRLAERYLAQGDTAVAVALYEGYARLILEQLPQDRALPVLRELIAVFVHTGFIPAGDAEFAEKLYDMAQARYGDGVWNEHDLFLRGINLELSGYDEEAARLYHRFIALFPGSELAAEVLTRRGFLLLFRLDEPESGIAAWEAVVRNYGESIAGYFCRYWLAVYWQGIVRPEPARTLLMQIPFEQWPFGPAARELLAYLTQGEGRSGEALFEPFALMLNPAHTMPVALSLSASPGRAFLDGDIMFEGSAQDFSAGTVQPQFAFEWFGQLGQTGDPGNVSAVTTRYQSFGPHIIWLSAATENTAQAMSQMAWIHQVTVTLPGIGNRIPAGTQHVYSARIEPPIPELTQLEWTWEFSGPQAQTVKGRNANVKFDAPGVYRGLLKISAGEELLRREFELEVVP